MAENKTVLESQKDTTAGAGNLTDMDDIFGTIDDKGVAELQQTEKEKKGSPFQIFLPKDGLMSNRTNKLLLIIGNLLLMIPLLLGRLTLISGIVGVVILGIQVYAIFFKSNDSVCATAYLPAFAFCDAIMLMALHIIPLLPQIHQLSLGTWNRNLTWLLPVALGVFLLFQHTWIADLGGALVAMSVVLGYYARGSLFNLSMLRAMWPTLLMVLVVNLFWAALRQLARTNDKSTETMGKWMGIILFVLGILVTVVFRDGYDPLLNLSSWFGTFAENALPWWRTVLIAVILQLLSVVMYNYNLTKFTTDSVVMTVMGWSVLLLRILLDWHFPLNWMLFLVFVTVIFVTLSVGKAKDPDRTVGLRNEVFYPALFLLAVLCALLLKNHLWINVIFTILFLLAIRSAYQNVREDKPRVFRWILIMVCMFAECVAVLWTKQFSVPPVAMLLYELVFASAIMVVANLRSNREGFARIGGNIVICAATCVLMLLTIIVK